MSAETISNVSREAPDPWLSRPVVGKFRVVSGVHSEGAVPGTYRIDPTGASMSKPRVYRAGEVVASRSDLTRYNPIAGERKFEQVADDTPDKYDGNTPAVPPEDLQSLTVPRLQELATSEGIDLGDLTKKSEIINWIRQCRGSVE